jgi:hypothetical protein
MEGLQTKKIENVLLLMLAFALGVAGLVLSRDGLVRPEIVCLCAVSSGLAVSRLFASEQARSFAIAAGVGVVLFINGVVVFALLLWYFFQR